MALEARKGVGSRQPRQKPHKSYKASLSFLVPKGWETACPNPIMWAGHKRFFPGVRGLNPAETSWIQTHSPDCFEDWEENTYSSEKGSWFVSLFAKWPLQEILICLLIGSAKQSHLQWPKPHWRGNLNPSPAERSLEILRLWKHCCLFIYEINPSLETEAYQPLLRWRSARPTATIRQGKHSAKQNAQKYQAMRLQDFSLWPYSTLTRDSGDTSTSQPWVHCTICVAENSTVTFLFLKRAENVFLPKSYVTLPLLDAHFKLLA